MGTLAAKSEVNLELFVMADIGRPTKPLKKPTETKQNKLPTACACSGRGPAPRVNTLTAAHALEAPRTFPGPVCLASASGHGDRWLFLLSEGLPAASCIAGPHSGGKHQALSPDIENTGRVPPSQLNQRLTPVGRCCKCSLPIFLIFTLGASVLDQSRTYMQT